MRTWPWNGVLLCAALIGGFKAGADHWLHGRLRQEALALAPAQFQFASVGLWPDALRLHQARLQASPWPGVTAEALIFPDVHRFVWESPLPHRLVARAQALTVEWAPASEETPGLVTALGYAPYYLAAREAAALGLTRPKGDAEARVDYRAEEKVLIASFHWRLDGIASLELEATLESIAHWPAQDSLVNQARLRAARLTLRGENLARVPQYLARREQQTPEAWRRQLLEKLTSDLGLVGLTLPLQTQQALDQFLTEGRQLEILLRPPRPIPWSRVSRLRPNQWFATLGVRVQVPK